MAEETFAEKTEQATAKRRADARKKGQVARSREIPTVLILFMGLSVLFFWSPAMYQRSTLLMAKLLSQIGTAPLDPVSFQNLTWEIFAFLAVILAPILLGVAAAAVLSNYVQVGSLFSWEAVQPDFGKINPWKGLGRLFSRQAAAELAKSIFKLVIISWVAYATIRAEWTQIVSLWNQETVQIFQYIGKISFQIFLKTVLVMAALAGLDYAFQRWSYEKSLRMTRREVQDEFKQTEGDPLIKSRIRSIQRELARKRMMAEVPKADVIITNPTHLAVALQYRYKDMNAPKVVAKGAELVAEKIKEIAKAHGVPLVENKPLAQTLYKTVEVGQAIPSSLYQLVADILAYVYRLRGKTA
ncbi:MAG: Flagellar biosynthetic protein FlhB [Deltaproteobacteria bacterium]|nr:Flagellar biosynthetic protein FlhB [Deltaproteobacteria bacterium]MBP1717121.1 Flagellar biosynthetic protein FlhB [Deltaproteobacteria bacterium]